MSKRNRKHREYASPPQQEETKRQKPATVSFDYLRRQHALALSSVQAIYDNVRKIGGRVKDREIEKGIEEGMRIVKEDLPEALPKEGIRSEEERLEVRQEIEKILGRAKSAMAARSTKVLQHEFAIQLNKACTRISGAFDLPATFTAVTSEEEEKPDMLMEEKQKEEQLEMLEETAEHVPVISGMHVRTSTFSSPESETFEELCEEWGVTQNERTDFIVQKLKVSAGGFYHDFIEILADESFRFGERMSERNVQFVQDLCTEFDERIVAAVQESCDASESVASFDSLRTNLLAIKASYESTNYHGKNQEIFGEFKGWVIDAFHSTFQRIEGAAQGVEWLIEQQEKNGGNGIDADEILLTVMPRKLEQGDDFPWSPIETQMVREKINNILKEARGQQRKLLKNPDAAIAKVVNILNKKLHGGYQLRTPESVRIHVLNALEPKEKSRSVSKKVADAASREAEEKMPPKQHQVSSVKEEERSSASEEESPSPSPSVIDAADEKPIEENVLSEAMKLRQGLVLDAMRHASSINPDEAAQVEMVRQFDDVTTKMHEYEQVCLSCDKQLHAEADERYRSSLLDMTRAELLGMGINAKNVHAEGEAGYNEKYLSQKDVDELEHLSADLKHCLKVLEEDQQSKVLYADIEGELQSLDAQMKQLISKRSVGEKFAHRMRQYHHAYGVNLDALLGADVHRSLQPNAQVNLQLEQRAHHLKFLFAELNRINKGRPTTVLLRPMVEKAILLLQHEIEERSRPKAVLTPPEEESGQVFSTFRARIDKKEVQFELTRLQHELLLVLTTSPGEESPNPHFRDVRFRVGGKAPVKLVKYREAMFPDAEFIDDPAVIKHALSAISVRYEPQQGEPRAPHKQFRMHAKGLCIQFPYGQGSKFVAGPMAFDYASKYIENAPQEESLSLTQAKATLRNYQVEERERYKREKVDPKRQ